MRIRRSTAKKETNTDILTGKVKAPSGASAFLDPVAKYGGESRAS
jgi:hypothetical protein